MFDPNFFTRKAQALLRMADTMDETAIAGRMRDTAAHCQRQAEMLTDREEPPAGALSASVETGDAPGS